MIPTLESELASLYPLVNRSFTCKMLPLTGHGHYLPM
jgi:hypothetical protein